MGMTIDEATLYMELYKRKLFNSVSDLDKDIEAYNTAIETMRKYQQLQADYENRLKADLKAILVELQLELEENTVRWYVGRVDGKSDDVVLMETINDIIQQKINALNVESEDPTPREAVDAIPRERIEQMVTEIKECIKACNDLKNDRVALAIESRESYDTRIVTYRHAIDIIHKYTKEQNND